MTNQGHAFIIALALTCMAPGGGLVAARFRQPGEMVSQGEASKVCGDDCNQWQIATRPVCCNCGKNYSDFRIVSKATGDTLTTAKCGATSGCKYVTLSGKPCGGG